MSPAPAGAADPVVGPEIASGQPVLVQFNTGFNPVASSDGHNFLVAFEDNSHIRAVRADGAGKVLDLSWLDFGEGATQANAAIAFGAGHYLVTWDELAPDFTAHVHGRFFRPDGTPEGAASFVISGGDGLFSAVSFDGARFVVAWLASEGGGFNNIHAALIDAGGLVAGSERAVSTTGTASTVSVSSSGRQSLIAWDDFGGAFANIFAARVDASGAVLDPGGFPVSLTDSFHDQPKVASNGESFLVVWHGDGSRGTVSGSVVAADGTLAAADLPISRAPDFNSAARPAVAFDGANYLVAWEDQRDNQSVFGAQISPQGVALGTDDVELSTSHPRSLFEHTSLAWNGSSFLFVFTGNGIEGSLIGRGPTIIAGALGFTGIPESQTSPRAAWNGDQFVVSWIDRPDASFTNLNAQAQRVTIAGQVLDAPAVQLSRDEHAFDVDLASTGHGSAVATWAGSAAGGTWHRSFDSNAALGPLALIEAQPTTAAPSAIGSNGAGYLLTFTDPASGTALDGLLLDRDGRAKSRFQLRPTYAFGWNTVLPAAQDYLVSYFNEGMWVAPVSHNGRVGADLAVADTLSLVTGATDGRTTLVAWSNFTDIQVRARFYADGAWRGEPIIVSPSGDGFGGAVAWDGRRYWVVWQTADRTALVGRSVDADGTLGAFFQVVNQECNAPSLASNGNGTMLVSCYAEREGGRTLRVVSRIITTFTPPGRRGG